MSKYLPLLKRASRSFREQHYSYIEHCEGHKNSSGESAPWCIKDHDSGSIISSYKTKEDAESGLRNMHIHKKGAVDPFKEKEICVWIRVQEGLDKPELIDFIMKKFNLDFNYAENLYYKALPEGLSSEELKVITELNAQLESSTSYSAEEILSLVNTAISKSTNLSEFVSNLVSVSNL